MESLNSFGKANLEVAEVEDRMVRSHEHIAKNPAPNQDSEQHRSSGEKRKRRCTGSHSRTALAQFGFEVCMKMGSVRTKLESN